MGGRLGRSLWVVGSASEGRKKEVIEKSNDGTEEVQFCIRDLIVLGSLLYFQDFCLFIIFSVLNYIFTFPCSSMIPSFSFLLPANSTHFLHFLLSFSLFLLYPVFS